MFKFDVYKFLYFRRYQILCYFTRSLMANYYIRQKPTWIRSTLFAIFSAITHLANAKIWTLQKQNSQMPEMLTPIVTGTCQKKIILDIYCVCTVGICLPYLIKMQYTTLLRKNNVTICCDKKFTILKKYSLFIF